MPLALLTPGAMQDDVFLQNLLAWFQHDNGDACDCAMLDMLRKLVQQPGVAAKLCSLGILPALEALQDSDSPQVQRSAGRTLTVLMQIEPQNSSQSLNLNQGREGVPRGRCQSNSPAQLGAKPWRHLSGNVSKVENSKHAQSKAYTHSTDSLETVSQAFGSQQGGAVLHVLC